MSTKILVANKILISNEVGSNKSGNESIEKFIEPKSGNLSKSQRSKSKKLAKFKKPSKNRNLPKFHVKKTRPRFLISDIKTTFNYL